jgi:hypothetical protein
MMKSMKSTVAVATNAARPLLEPPPGGCAI